MTQLSGNPVPARVDTRERPTRLNQRIGVYPDLDSPVYHANRAASSTILRELMRSPAHAENSL